MKIFICILFGYLIGSLSPSALFAKLKKTDLRNEGTGNLGATNALMVMGRWVGVIVMIIDITKAVAAVKIAEVLFPTIKIAGLLAGASTVLGHIFPFYMKFKGGKGVAAFAGMILAFDPLLFILLLIICFIAMVTINSGVALTISATILFPLLVGIFYEWTMLFPSIAASALVAFKHIPNLRDAIQGKDIKARDFMKKFIFSRRKTNN